MSLLGELRRRNVLRAGTAWLALSWLLVVLADLLFPVLELPTVAVRALTVALMSMLPLVLFVSWRFEMTASGLRVDRGPRGDNPENARTGRRIDQLIIATVLLALAMSALRQFVVDRVDRRGERPTDASAPAEAAPVRAADAPVRDDAEPVDPRSLAVLAFANLSPDPANAFLAEGIAEEILNALARIPGLKVASRTSSFAFRDAAPGAREIGSKLGVAYVLDGSLRRQEDHVRVSIQLIDASNDQPLWSGSFDRELVDIFALQEDVAQAVVDALAEPLGVREVKVRRATEDLQAYELFLRGRQMFAQRGSSLEAARSLLEDAVQRDPHFAEAWAVLAATLYVMPSYFQGHAEQRYREAGAAADKALQALADQPDAMAVRARLAADAGQRLEALDLIERALRAEPNSANSWMWKGLIWIEAGRIDEAHAAFSRGHELDPLSGIHFGWLGATELIRGDTDAARAHLERAHTLGWRGPASAWLLKLALQQGDGEEISRRFDAWLRDDGRIGDAQRDAHRALFERMRASASSADLAAAFADVVRAQPDYDWTTLALFLGLTDAAMDEALRAKPTSGQILLMMIWSPVDQAFRMHPRFAELAERAGLPAFWAVHGEPAGCRWTGPPERRLECDR